MFYVIAWCATSVLVSTGGIQKYQCFDTEYNVYSSSAQVVSFYKTLLPSQQNSANIFEMKELQVKKNWDLVPVPIVPSVPVVPPGGGGGITPLRIGDAK